MDACIFPMERQGYPPFRKEENHVKDVDDYVVSWSPTSALPKRRLNQCDSLSCTVVATSTKNDSRN